MRLSKRIISILIISILVIIIGSSAVACLPLTTTEGGGTTEGAQTAEPGGFADIFASYGTWVWLAILVVAFYFLLIRPQRTRSKKAQELMSSLQRGDEVVTIGGVHGRIKDIREDVIIVTIASGVDIKINKSAVSKKASQ
ncbi:MAG: preprotein translocase subunit YajC [Actinobacteria bacterium]|nr:preprotein translocase subunit YajC [Actinomycetota bacterium]